MKKSSSVGAGSAQKPAKKQKVGTSLGSSGGLSRFGFTGGKGDLSPSPSAADYSQCPLCSGLFNTSSIVEHASSCLGELKMPSASSYNHSSESSQSEEIRITPNAFDLMRKSAALKPVTLTPSIMHFALIMKDEKLLPVFSASADYIEQLYTQCKTSTDQPQNWTCEANVKKFRWRFDHTTPSHKDIRLHVSTNIQPDLGVSYADTAPISTAWLKSMLQKAVRRKLSFKAVKLANMMCKTTPVPSNLSSTSTSQSKSINSPVGSPAKSKPVFNSSKSEKSSSSSNISSANNNATLLSELLRRLPIICLEDAALHPSYPVLIWLMVAVSKGYSPPKYLLHIALLITNDIASCTYRDCIAPDGCDLGPQAVIDTDVTANTTSTTTSGTITPLKSTNTMGNDTTTTNINTSTSTNTNNANHAITNTTHTWEGIENDSFRTLLACICIRASFGGMVGDMQMLDKYAQLWHYRLLCGASISPERAYTNIYMHDSGSSGDGSGGSSGSSGGSGSSGSSGSECNGSTVPHNIGCYLHSSYTNAFFLSVGNAGWAHQLFDNFQPCGMVLVLGKHTTHNEHLTLGDVVERTLVNVCAQHVNGTYMTPLTLTGSIARTTPALATLLKVTLHDLVPEGLDQHCDYSLLPAILNACDDKVQQLTLQLAQRERSGTQSSDSISATIAILKDPHLEANIKSAIWLFRSANNGRRLYPYCAENAHNEVNKCVKMYHQELVDTDLADKRKLARLWGVVCPMIVAFCERKMIALSHRL